jgi:hypothetical protein
MDTDHDHPAISFDSHYDEETSNDEETDDDDDDDDIFSDHPQIAPSAFSEKDSDSSETSEMDWMLDYSMPKESEHHSSMVDSSDEVKSLNMPHLHPIDYK